MWRLASEVLCHPSKQTAVDYDEIIELEAHVMFIQSASLGIIRTLKESDLFFL